MLNDQPMANMLRSALTTGVGGLSLIRPVGTGVATENKLLSSKDCWFQVLEWYPYDQNELKSDVDELSDTGVDAKGEAYEVSVKFGKSVKATWLPSGGNRVSAPDLRRGERAEIFRLGDSDRYYWRAIELDQGVRRLETAVFMYSNTQDETEKELNPDNSWVMEISTHQKTMSIITPKSDGEAFGYNVQLNTKDSTFVLQDDGGQTFELNSKERVWHFANNDGSSVTMDKTNVTCVAPDKFLVKCNEFEVQAKSSIKEVSQNHTVDTQSYKLTTNSYNNTSQSYKVNTGNWTVSYSTGSNSGTTSFNGTLTNNGINVSSTHRHGGVQGGNGTTLFPM